MLQEETVWRKVQEALSKVKAWKRVHKLALKLKRKEIANTVGNGLVCNELAMMAIVDRIKVHSAICVWTPDPVSIKIPIKPIQTSLVQINLLNNKTIIKFANSVLRVRQWRRIKREIAAATLEWSFKDITVIAQDPPRAVGHIVMIAEQRWLMGLWEAATRTEGEIRKTNNIG